MKLSKPLTAKRGRSRHLHFIHELHDVEGCQFAHQLCDLRVRLVVEIRFNFPHQADKPSSVGADLLLRNTCVRKRLHEVRHLFGVVINQWLIRIRINPALTCHLYGFL